MNRANGVDAEGNPKNFTEADLRQFQRVVTKNGFEWIVVEHDDYFYLTTCKSTNGFVNIILEPQECDISEEYRVVEVYNCCKYIAGKLDVSEKGELIWKYGKPKGLSEFETRLAYFQVHINAVEENLESLKRELEILKEK